ncbi:DEAD/DEAH box helicase [Sphingomonas sp. FW199]|uniref:DEAD/DEAH box helicase n=1 Tax=Sphingomonas sp. FW199 TaxID=3400217 RepID=UPI003CF02EDC
MVDFRSLKKTSGSTKEIDPRKVFQHLIKPEGVNELYASQSELLDAWSKDRAQRDSVLKLPTGGGKSLVGLLMAQATLNELNLPVLYVTPTNQLNEQVCAEADRFGIPVAVYRSAKEGLPADFVDGKAIGIANYDAVFNGMSKFGTQDRQSEVQQLGLIILDDAHAAFETVWKSFTFEIKSSDHRELYQNLTARFRGAFRQLNRGHTFDDVVSGKEYFVLDVPYWAWLQKVDEFAAALQEYGPEKIDRWAWAHLRDELHVCQVLISKESISILPIVPLVDRASAYRNAKRRIYMSATIADDSEVVRTFGVRASRVASPLTAASLAGVGERMILAPALIQLPAHQMPSRLVKQLVSSAVQHDKNVAILTPSFASGKEWKDIASVPDDGTQTVQLIDNLRTKRGICAVLPRRYDGVDLPGDACRVLIMDGLPYGSSSYDAWRITALSYGSPGSTLAQRIEQAIGRGSRGTSDYCVVVLTGADLITWIGKISNQRHLSGTSKRQLEIGLEVSRAVESADDFIATAWKCLNRDPDWRAYHADELGSAAVGISTELERLQAWEAERDGIEQLRIRQFAKAISHFNEAIDHASDATIKGWFHQLKARASYMAGNEPQAEEWQTKAYGLNFALTAPVGQIAVHQMLSASQQAHAVASRIGDFLHPGVALSRFEKDIELLTPYSTSGQFEGALAELFSWIGFAASRPDNEYKEGPDVLARADTGPYFVIEAKSRKKAKNKLTKSLHGQVLSHENWLRTHYGDVDSKRIIVYPNNDAEYNAETHGTLALTFAMVNSIISSTRSMLKAVGEAADAQRPDVAALQLAQLKLTPADIIQGLVGFTDTHATE